MNVNEPGMCNLIESQTYTEDNILNSDSRSDDFSIFASTFGAYETGP